jgi:hypothetical protein
MFQLCLSEDWTEGEHGLRAGCRHLKILANRKGIRLAVSPVSGM